MSSRLALSLVALACAGATAAPIECVPGTYWHTRGSVDCGAAQGCPATGGTAAECCCACHAGYYCPGGAKSQPEDACPAGTTSPPGATSAAACTGGAPTPTPTRAPPPPPPPAGARPKRGFVANVCAGPACADWSLLANATAWYYGYEVSSPYCGAAGACASAGAFVPMPWCLSHTGDAFPAYVNRSGLLLGYNEPNFPTQCNKSAAAVAAAWPALSARWPAPGALASPGVALDGTQWLDDFFANCTALHGAGGCRVDAIAAHDYSCDAPATLAYLQRLSARYARPTLLTEFACGSVNHKRPVPEQLAFMAAVVPLLDAAPFVARYAWMSARDPDGLRNLVEVDAGGAQRLSALGRLYVSL